MNIRYPEKLKAAVLFEINNPLKIIDIDIPKLKKGQILVKILYSGVCRSQLMEKKGSRGKDPWLPHLLGHEGSGEVIAVGKGVTKVKPGDGVILTWIKSNGLEALHTPKYIFGKKRINSGHITTFSNYSIISENRCVKKPNNLDFKLATLFGCALPTGSGMVMNQINPKKGSTIAVIGLGGIGLSALAILQSYECKKIIAIDISEEKLKFSKKLGATNIINSETEDMFKKIKKITNGTGVDYCIESAGFAKTIENGFSIIKKNGGKLIFASHPDSRDQISIDPFDSISGKQIFGSWGGEVSPDRDFKKIYSVIKKHKVPINHMITKEYFLEDITIAIDDLEKGIVFRPIIKMNHDR